MLYEMMEEVKKMAALERRRAKRASMKLPVIVYSASKDNVTSLYFTKDISKSGLFMSGSAGFEVGQRVYLELSVPLQVVSKRIRLIGRVVRASFEGYGIEFEKMYEQDYLFLGNYLPEGELD